MDALEAALHEAPAPAAAPGAALEAARPESQVSLDDRVAVAPGWDVAATAPAPAAQPARPPQDPAATDRSAPARPQPAAAPRPIPAAAVPRPVPSSGPRPSPTRPRPGWLRPAYSRGLALGLLGLVAALVLAALLWSYGPRPGARPNATPIGGGEPTAATTAGRPFALFYDANSFYLLNLSESEGPIAPIAFERLDGQGQPVNRFDGSRWAEFHETTRPGWCMRIEILESPPYLQPPECVRGYLSTRTPVRGDAVIFWTPAEGSDQFRVLWNDLEVGRCDIAAGLCRVFLPSS
jgi:hypothetical protein